jgi:hypothetical protein
METPYGSDKISICWCHLFQLNLWYTASGCVIVHGGSVREISDSSLDGQIWIQVAQGTNLEYIKMMFSFTKYYISWNWPSLALRGSNYCLCSSRVLWSIPNGWLLAKKVSSADHFAFVPKKNGNNNEDLKQRKYADFSNLSPDIYTFTSKMNLW